MIERCDLPLKEEMDYRNYVMGKERMLKRVTRLDPNDLTSIPEAKRVELQKHLVTGVFEDLVDAGRSKMAQRIHSDNIGKSLTTQEKIIPSYPRVRKPRRSKRRGT